MTYLTAEIQSPETLVFRYMAEVASNDHDDEGVPFEFKTIDVLVTERSKMAVATLIKACGWLDNFTLVSIWEPWEETGLPDDAPF